VLKASKTLNALVYFKFVNDFKIKELNYK